MEPNNSGNILVLASSNKKKIVELKELLPNFSVHTARDIGFLEEIPEPYLTFAENAQQKAQTIFAFCGHNVLADDSGISVEALDGAPGVWSARFAGEGAGDQENLDKLIKVMEGKDNRRAWYTAVLCLIWNGQTHFFKGKCHGTLLKEPKGSNGFGYDPIFVPDGYQESFAELSPEVKRKISHRAKAMQLLQSFLQQQ